MFSEKCNWRTLTAFLVAVLGGIYPAARSQGASNQLSLTGQVEDLSIQMRVIQVRQRILAASEMQSREKQFAAKGQLTDYQLLSSVKRTEHDWHDWNDWSNWNNWSNWSNAPPTSPPPETERGAG